MMFSSAATVAMRKMNVASKLSSSSSSLASSRYWSRCPTTTAASKTLSSLFQNKYNKPHRLFLSTMMGGPVALDTDRLQTNIETLAPSIAKSLMDDGYFTLDDPTALFDDDNITAMFILETMRAQAEALREEEGRYEQSWSESIDGTTGKVTRFDKPGVFACEPDGGDYDTAPDLVSYMATLITTLPPALNEHLQKEKSDDDDDAIARISNQAFNAKLAVTCANSEYPLHVDNSVGVEGGDTRKLTCILYLNPEYNAKTDKGELRLHLLGNNNNHDDNDDNDTNNDNFVDVEPSAGRWLLFWTDEMPHKVLPTGETATDRYALTIWLADEDPVSHIHNPRSKFAELRVRAFEKKED